MFRNDATGELVAISGTDPVLGPWTHRAFVPAPLRPDMPTLSPTTHLHVADARAALAALDSTARQLPNPTLLRSPTLRAEAQSTSALEGTYAPLGQVLIADEDEPGSPDMREILNYLRMANYGFAWIHGDRPITTAFLCDLNALLMTGMPLAPVSGRLRDQQVVIGLRADVDRAGFPIHAARFVPTPADAALTLGLGDLVEWLRTDHAGHIDPVVASAMAHYQYETLHPFHDGNGRIGRLLVVLQLQHLGVLSEPTLTVSPWFEARRAAYYDHLLAVSTDGDWDAFVGFFAQGLEAAAQLTRRQMIALVAVQSDLKEVVRASALRADSAQALVDLAIANPTFTVRRVESELALSYGRANKLVGQLVQLGVLQIVDRHAYKRRFYAPRVLDVLASGGGL